MSENSLEHMFRDDDKLGKALDAFTQETKVVAEFYVDPESGKLASMFYKAEHIDKVNEHRVALPTKGHINVRTPSGLAAFIQDYIAELKKEDLLDKSEEKPLGGTFGGEVLYLQIYRKPTEALETVGKIVNKILYGPK